jgi:outer membrane protein assembly factor BamB
VQRFVADCTGAPATIGKRSAAIVAVNADTLAVDWSWQVPFSEQAFDADFGATPTLCGADNNLRVVGVANKDGIFYAFNADALGAPIWQRTIAVGGGGPESAQGSISSASCAGGAFYVGAGKPPDGALVCASDTGQVWALSAATGEPRWRNPHCTGLVIGPVTAASGLLIVGANCRNPALTGCERQLDVLDMATGNTRYRGTSAELSGLGDIVSGAAVVNRLLVVGDGVPAPPENGNPYAPYFPLTGTVRALNAQIGVYLPTIER